MTHSSASSLTIGGAFYKAVDFKQQKKITLFPPDSHEAAHMQRAIFFSLMEML